jgi:hypothetical protein
MNELNLYKSNRGEESQLVDWTKAAGSLTSGIATAAGMRELRRAENEQFKKSAEEVVGKEVDLSNQSMDKLLMNASFSGRDKIVQLNNDMRNGRISRAQYKAAMADISTNWKNTADYISNIDKRYSEALERQETDKASEIEIGIIEYFGQLNDIGNKAITFDDNGSISLSILDDKGKPTGAYQNINSLNNLMNSRFDKVDLVGMVTAGTEKFPDWKNRTVTDIRMSPTFTQNKNKLVNTILADPRSTASILVDYGNFGYYFVDKDGSNKQKALEKLQQNNPSATEADLILMEQNEDGRMNAKLTPEQLKAAQKLVDAEIEQRFRREVDFAPGYGSGGLSGLSANQEAVLANKNTQAEDMWQLTYDSISLPRGLKRSQMSGKLTASTGGKIIFTPNPSGNGYLASLPNGSDLVDESSPLVNSEDIFKMIGEVVGNDLMNRDYFKVRYANYNPKKSKKKGAPSPKGSANNFLNWATEGSTVDYSSFN